MFYCDKCGLCCMKVGESPFFAWLDRGDGVCRHLDVASKLCRIYEKRPILCNVDLTYSRFFQHKMSQEAFYSLNRNACNYIKKLKGD